MCISLPFLLGLIGLMYHATKNMKSFTYYYYSCLQALH
jgi:hypothetical protein